MKIKRYVWVICAAFGLVLTACGTPSVTNGALSPNGNITLQSAWARPVTLNDTAATAQASDHSMPGANGTAMTVTDTAMGNMVMGNGPTGAVYMVIVNISNTPDQLVKVTTDVADSVEIHNTVIENNVAHMRSVSSVEIPAAGQFEFKPGGYHMMLVNVHRTLRPGEVVPLALTFRNAGQVQVNAEVRKS